MRIHFMKKQLNFSYDNLRNTYDIFKNNFCRLSTLLLILFIAFTECAFANSVYVNNHDSNSVSVINTQTNTVIATVPVGITPDFVVITPDGTQVYVADFGGTAVSVINTQTNTVIATIPVGINPYLMAVTPDGTQVYVPNNGSNT